MDVTEDVRQLAADICRLESAYGAAYNFENGFGDLTELVGLIARFKERALTTAQSEAAELRKEVERLRGALIQCGRAAGAGLADTVSTDFLLLVPGEVEAKLERLRARVAELEATVNEWPGV